MRYRFCSCAYLYAVFFSFLHQFCACAYLYRQFLFFSPSHPPALLPTSSELARCPLPRESTLRLKNTDRDLIFGPCGWNLPGGGGTSPWFGFHSGSVHKNSYLYLVSNNETGPGCGSIHEIIGFVVENLRGE